MVGQMLQVTSPPLLSRIDTLLNEMERELTEDLRMYVRSPLRRKNPGTQDKFDHDKGQKSAISGLSTGFFAFSPVLMCNLVRRVP